MSTYPDEFKQLEEQIEQLQAENKRLNTIIDNRAEDRIVLEKYQKLQAEWETIRQKCQVNIDAVIGFGTAYERGRRTMASEILYVIEDKNGNL